MTRQVRCRLSLLAAALLPFAASADDAIEAGRRIYMDGVSNSGESVRAIVSGDVEISGEFMVCGKCHRRSGLGASEGPSVAPPVVGSLLYEPYQLPTSRPPAPPVLRPAYTRETLARSIRDGISSTGRELDPLMPRYPLSDEDMSHLIAYLESLEVGPAPGVTDTEIHFATIVTDDVDAAARQAMLDVMTTFVEQKNSETRYETKRAENGPWHKDWVFKNYRKWRLHTWDLSGSPSDWPEQLERLYSERPVFAVLNGLSRQSWEPVHGFCEDLGIPCLFPTTDLPVADREDFYNVYLSKGIALEAAAVAQQLQNEGVSGTDVLQIYDPDNEESATAAAAFSRQFGADVAVATPSSLLESVAQRVVVAWLDAAGIAALALHDPEQVFLSGTLLGPAEAATGIGLGPGARIAYSAELPGRRARLLARSTGWLRFKRIYSAEHEAIQANAYFTMKMTGGALAAIRNYFNRDYFLESIEHMVDNATYTSVYPQMSLAPEQRFVSKGVRIARFEADGRLVADVDRLVPNNPQ